MTNVELNWEDPLPSYAIAKNRKNIQYVLCVGIGTPLLGDRWVTELARKDVKDQNHPDNRTRCNDLGNISIAGHKVTSCVISVRFVSVNKLWGKGLRSGLEKVLPTFRPKFPPVPRLAQPIGSHEEKIWTTEKLLQVLKRTFQQKMWGQVHSSDKKSNGNQVLWRVSVYLLAEHWTSHAGSSSGGIFADLLHLLLLPLATPGCTCCTSQKVETTTTTVCCRLLQVTRLHMLHISNGNNNKSNRFLSRLKPQKEQQQQQQVYASLDRMQQAIQNVNWYCFTPVSDDGVSINYRMESARIENTKVL